MGSFAEIRDKICAYGMDFDMDMTMDGSRSAILGEEKDHKS